MFPSILTAFHPCSPIFPLLCFLFPAVYPCIPDTTSTYFPKLSVWHAVWPTEREERGKRKRKKRKRKGNPSRVSTSAPPLEVENRKYARFKISGRTLDPIKLSAAWYTIAKQCLLSSRLAYRLTAFSFALFHSY